MKRALFAGVVIAVSACAQDGARPEGAAPGWTYDLRLAPVKGPIAEATPKLMIRAKVTSNRKESEGTLSFALPEGVTCDGTWSVKNDQSSPERRAAGSHPHVKQLTQDATGNITIKHEKQSGEGQGTCTDGSTFIMANVNGMRLVMDSKDNLYRVR
jgi:hypothetical protein